MVLKRSYFGICELEFWKTSVILEISTLKFIKMEFLTHTVNFCTGSAFFKGPDPDPGPLYKVCPKKCFLNWIFVGELLYYMKRLRDKVNNDIFAKYPWQIYFCPPFFRVSWNNILIFMKNCLSVTIPLWI